MNIFQKVTLKTLKENKTRTIVTIIGIILSLSMFTAVTTSISSFQNFMLEITKTRGGNWHGNLPASITDKDTLCSDKSIEAVSFLEHVGYARLTDSMNPDKPYLFIGGMDENASDLLPIILTEGHMPENEHELLIPNHLAYNGGITYNLNDTVTLEIGDRISKDEKGKPYILGQETGYLYTEEELRDGGISDVEISTRDTESLSLRTSCTYRIVGFYNRPPIEPYVAPGYTALTISSTKAASTNVPGTTNYTAYIRFYNPQKATPWLNQHCPDYTGSQINSDLLRMYAASYESSYNDVLYGLGSVLIFIILFGSVSLIHNAFSISITERTKQFGLLASLGATKKQLIRSVLFEAFFLCIIGIPLGILAGITGIGITFALLGNSLSNILWGDWAVPLSLHVAPWAIAFAAFLGFITVLISAWLPARRCAKLSPMDAIRQTTDITIRPGKVRTSRLTYRLFGLPGMLASKNFKRNRKKYRATILSLFVSIVLFISASSFCSYLLNGIRGIMSDSGFDITYYRYDSNQDITNDEILTRLSSLDSVSDAAYIRKAYVPVTIARDALNPGYLDFLSSLPEEFLKLEGNEIKLNIDIIFVDNDSYAAYLKDAGLSDPMYTDYEHPAAIASDFVRSYNRTSGTYTTLNILRGENVNINILQAQPPEGYHHVGYYNDEHGDIINYFESSMDTELLEIPAAACTKTVPLTIGTIPETTPFFLGESYSQGLSLMYPVSAMEFVLGKEQAAYLQKYNTSFYFTASDHKKATEDISQTLRNMGLDSNSVYDDAEESAQQRTLVMIITIFSYGFIILISLIAIANVFNTISTNLQLRKREFAMLKSTGMTPESFRIMMCYECLLYGIKGLLYGLPASILITFWVYNSISAGWDTSFYIPWYSLVIAIGSVFLVVGSTMIYSMHKIGRENIMDNLKNENI